MRGTVFRRQILTSKDGPRNERIVIIIMPVDAQHRYSNEAKKASQDIYDDSEYSALYGLKDLLFIPGLLLDDAIKFLSIKAIKAIQMICAAFSQNI